MVTSELGQCEWFVWDLRKSGLIERGQLDQVVNDFLRKNPRSEAPALAAHLTAQGTLTAFQAERVLNGKTQGLVLNQYVLLDAIGSGSMGQVFKAVNKSDNSVFALKVLPRRSMWNVRLARRQVRQFSGFQHPAVVPFVDVGTAGGLHYLGWPLVDGQTVEAVIQQHGKLPPAHAATIASQVAQGLAIAHQNNLFHGLLKPSNVMMGHDGQARILDFGIGSLLVENEGESLVDTMSTANTLTSGLDYASPECIMEPSNRTPAGDQYSLGCLLYFTLAGRPPFPDGSAVEKMMAHQAKEPASVKDFAPDAPDGLVAVVEKLLAKKPEDRYGGCDQVVEALAPYMAKTPFVAAALGRASSHKMPGLAGKSSPARPAAVETPPPGPSLSRVAAQHVETPTPSSQLTGNNVPKPAPLPSRASVQAPTKDSRPFQPTGSKDSRAFPPTGTKDSRPFQSTGTKDSRPLNLTPAPGPLGKMPTPPPAMTPAPTPLPADPDRWIPGNDAQEEQTFGTFGVIATTLLITVLVYFGVLKLLQQ